jgi:hypothetical protein
MVRRKTLPVDGVNQELKDIYLKNKMVTLTPVSFALPADNIIPCKVFIKFHSEGGGDLEVFKSLAPSKHEEAQLCYDYGRSGLGAQVYGFFETQDGQVEDTWSASLNP